MQLDNPAHDDVRRLSEFIQREENRRRKLMTFDAAGTLENLPLYKRGYDRASALASNGEPVGRKRFHRMQIWIL